MPKSLTRVLLLLCTAILGGAEAAAPILATAPHYGANPAAGNTFVHDGVALYYEVYGTGEPLLLVHGNGGSIGSLAAQIEYFRGRRQVIAMDSRDQGRSGDSEDPLTYERMTDDLAALLDHLEVGPVDVLGWSDGGIEALLLGMRYPDKVKRLVAMSPNLNPSEEALYPETIALTREMLDSMRDRGARHAGGPPRTQGDGDAARRAEHRRIGTRIHRSADADHGRRSRRGPSRSTQSRSTSTCRTARSKSCAMQRTWRRRTIRRGSTARWSGSSANPLRRRRASTSTNPRMRAENVSFND